MIAYNDWALGLYPALGTFTKDLSQNCDIQQIKHANRKSTEKCQNRRKYLRGIRKCFKDRDKLAEGQLYGYGQF